jgi:hypothetical protein
MNQTLNCVVVGRLLLLLLLLLLLQAKVGAHPADWSPAAAFCGCHCLVTQE